MIGVEALNRAHSSYHLIYILVYLTPYVSQEILIPLRKSKLTESVRLNSRSTDTEPLFDPLPAHCLFNDADSRCLPT